MLHPDRFATCGRRRNGLGRRLRQRVEEALARLLAAAAGLGADAAVLVLVGVLLALLGAEAAGRAEGLDLLADERVLRLRLAREDAAGGGADVGAVEVGADALAELGGLLLREAGVGAGRAGLLALEAVIDAGDEGVEVIDGGRMGGEDVAGDHVGEGR